MQTTDAELFYSNTSSFGESADLGESVVAPEPAGKTDAETFYPQASSDEGAVIEQSSPGAQAQPGEYQLEMPEGISVDPHLLTAATPVFKELGLTSEQASKFVPLVQQVQQQYLSSMMAEHDEVRTAWKNEARADGTIGGANWNESIRLASNALNVGGAGPGSEVRKLLNQTGLGDHPAFIRLFRNLGTRLGSATAPKTDADMFYPGRGR